jgi:hypothetical protein
MFCVITNQTEANVWLTSVALDKPLRRLIVVTYASSQWRGNKFLIEHEMAANMTDDLLNNDMRTGIHLLDAVWLKIDHFFIAKLIIFVAYVNWALFVSIGLHCMCIEQRLICLVWIKQNCLVKLKNCSCVFMSSAWTKTWSWGSLCQSFCLFYSFFQCQI